MKTNKFIVASWAIIAVLLLSSCSALVGIGGVGVQRRTPHLEIQRGMSMREVVDLLGKPHYRRFDTQSEEWEYVLPNRRPNRIVVTFGRGVVTSLNTYDVPEPTQPIPEPQPTPPYYPPQPSYPPYGYPQDRGVDEGWFDEFFARVQAKPFDSDKMRLIRSISEHQRISSGQCLRLMSLFTWDSERLKVLRAVVSRLAERRDAYKIIDSLTFDSNKKEASRILGVPYTDE